MESELKRLGRLIVARRKQRGLPTRQAFADSLKITYRVLTDLENGTRQLGAKTYLQIEKALGWQPGSVEAVLAGGEPTPIVDDPFDQRRALARRSNEIRRALLEIEERRDFTPEEDWSEADSRLRDELQNELAENRARHKALIAEDEKDQFIKRSTPHDQHFARAARLLRNSHESIQAGDHIGAINGLEGVWSTVELLVDRITDEALQKGIENAGQSSTPAGSPTQSAASSALDKGEEVTQAMLDLAARTVDEEKPE